MKDMHDVGKDSQDKKLPDLTASFNTPSKMIEIRKPFFKVLKALTQSKVLSLAMDEHGDPRPWFPLKKGTGTSKGALNPHFPLGLPRDACVDITGVHLNPEYLTQYVTADERLKRYYGPQLDLVSAFNSAYTTQPPSVVTDEVASAGNYLVHNAVCAWAALWSIDAALLVGNLQNFIHLLSKFLTPQTLDLTNPIRNTARSRVISLSSTATPW